MALMLFEGQALHDDKFLQSEREKKFHDASESQKQMSLFDNVDKIKDDEDLKDNTTGDSEGLNENGLNETEEKFLLLKF